MKVENPVISDDRVQTLVSSGQSLESAPDGDPTVEECPLKKKKREEELKKLAEQPKKPPVRLLLWNIQELGGGFFRPHVRPSYLISAYAGILKKLEIDIAVILGITDTIGLVPKAQKDFIDFDDQLKDTGPAELDSILKELGSTWKVAWPKPKKGSGYLYHYRTTTALLWNTANGAKLESSGIADSQSAVDLGLTGKFFCGSFSVPNSTSSKVFVAAPLGTRVAPREWALAPAPAPDEDLQATITELPEIAVLAISSPEDLASSSSFASFKARMDAQYRAPGSDGTILKDQWWFPRADSDEGILDNFAAVDPGDALLQDSEMHWEGLDQPVYAENLDKVKGRLTDAWLLKNSGSGTPPKVEEMRVVDLIAAALKSETLGKVRPVKPENSKEDSAISDQRDTYRKQMGTPEWKEEPVNEISDCAHFSTLLSDHWPVIMQLRYEE